MEYLKPNAIKKLLRVAIIGCPNAGKSTLLNKLVGADISAVSNKVHTTRKNTIGVYTQADAQLEFYDSPGLVTRKHLLRHRLEDSFLTDPGKAIHRCDMIAVIVDASNERERWRLNREILSLLKDHSDKMSILVLNKVDLVKDKRFLLDIGTRLTQGFLEGRSCIEKYTLKRMTNEEILRLNLGAHIGLTTPTPIATRKHKYVIDLESGTDYQAWKPRSPDEIGFKNFTRVYSISALHEEGIDQLKLDLIDKATPVEEWPHGPDYLTNQNTREIVHGVIRGRVLDYVDHEVPYLIKYKYSVCNYDEMGSLHVHMTILCPHKYMVAKVLGQHGVTISRVVSESRDLICKTLGCDVKLDIQVEALAKKV